MGELEQLRNKYDPILFSDELWLIANNSKVFANRSKSIIKNDVGLNSNLILAMQILTKTKRSYFYI